MRPPDAGHGFAHDRRDLEIERLKRQLEEARAREGKIRAEERERFSALSAASKRFAASMRSRMDERRRAQRRLDAQYAVGRVLEECRDLREAAPKVFRVLAGRLGWEAGVLWMLEGGALRCRGVWRLGSEPPNGAPDVFGEACRRCVLPRGVGLPGRVWAREEACWVEDVLEDADYPHREAAAAQGLRCALAFPIQNGERPVGVFELLKKEKGPVEEDAMRVAYLLGQQIGQFVERWRSEEALRASEGRLQLALEAAQMGTFLWHVEEDRTQADARLLALFGVPDDGEITLAEALSGMIHPDDSAGYAEAVAGATDPAGEGELRAEIRVVHPNGVERWLAVTALTHFEGVPRRATRMSGVAADITERKRTQEALLEYEAWLGIAQRAAGSGTWEWDLATDEIRWSDEHRALFGFDAQTPVTRERWWATVHPEDLPRLEEAGRRSYEEGEEWSEVEYRIRVAGKTRWIDARGRTVRDRAGRPVRILGISVDVTERKRAEEERDRLLAREWVAGAEVAERERISRELHDRVAHSMAVAHQSLQLYGVLAEKDPARAAERLELAREMTKASLETTRNLSAELRELDAEENLAEEIRHLLDVSVPAGVRAEFSVEGDEAHVPGHVRGQIFLLLREAVRNALAHSGCDALSVGLDIDPERIVGSVEDDGRGFDAGGGNGGVGLRSMRERAALLDGAFKLNCEPGRGTRVEVSVPLTGRG